MLKEPQKTKKFNKKFYFEYDFKSFDNNLCQDKYKQ